MKRTITISCVRVFALMFIAIMTMAVSCPGPEPESESELEPVAQTKSAERNNFESSSTEGLYIKGNCIVSYDADFFQKAVNKRRRNYRLQSDDQERYLNVTFTDVLPSYASDNALCSIRYSVGKGETVLVVKLAVIRSSGGYLWLWNELQKIGVIIPAIK